MHFYRIEEEDLKGNAIVNTYSHVLTSLDEVFSQKPEETIQGSLVAHFYEWGNIYSLKTLARFHFQKVWCLQRQKKYTFSLFVSIH